MSPKKKWRPPRKCGKTGKIRYKTELDAKLALARAQQYGAWKRKTREQRYGQIRPYQCEFCHEWHTTSQRKGRD